jgi:hypothetical protein
MIRLIVFLCLLASLLMGCALNAQPSVSWTSDNSAPAIPNTLGVNIHFTDPQPGEVKMLSEAGFQWVRMDFVWKATEVEKGKYDFASYDRLLSALDERKLRPLFILDYTNTLYDDDAAPFTNEGRQAFAKWAAAAVRHFRGRGILWEIYNEPNTGFWTPSPKVSDYVKLALETSKAIHDAAPDEQVIGPAVWGVDLEFIEECFRSGLLNYWSAVSVHPYRKTDPETVVADYARLRNLIAKYAPEGKRVPIISSEWGYSSASSNIDEGRQAALLARQMLINQSQGIALSIWYDWHDDGRNSNEIEHHFGTVLSPFYSQRDPVYDVKPAYRSVQTLSSLLHGYSFSAREPSADTDYVLVFRGKGEPLLVAWTTARAEHPVTIPVAPGTYRVLSHTGEASLLKQTTGSGLVLNLTNAPQYIKVERP